jgi:hypothetical protein
MTAQDRVTAREPKPSTERPAKRARLAPAGAMALQSSRCQEAAPQMFVRLTGSHLAKPAVSRNIVTE